MAQDYTQLITSEHADKPKFVATVALLTGAVGEVFDTAMSIPARYDLDSAVGVQLDAVGEWVGLGRLLTAPIDNTWFSFDTPAKGWDEGYWKEPFVPTEGVALLDDFSYRAALRLQIAVNHWSGQLGDYMLKYVVLENSAGNYVVVKDNQDMSMNVYVLGLAPSLFLQLAIQQEQLVPKPFGVRIAGYTFVNTPVFGTDHHDALIDGLDIGAFLT